MGIIQDSVTSILPRGRLKLRTYGHAVLCAIADAVEDLRQAGLDIIAESWPGTATDSLPAWHQLEGVAYDPDSMSIEGQRAMLAAMETTRGGRTLADLQAQFDKEFGGRVVVSEAYIIGVTGRAVCGLARCGLISPIIYPLGYDVTGTIYSIVEASRVASILARYAPAHLEPNSTLTDLSASAIAISGLARCGIARTGKTS